MIKRQFGQTDMVTSIIGLGCWAIGGTWWGGQDEQESIAAIHAAVDAGVNWIDTAPIYGGGVSERIVGRALAALPADTRPWIFTKYGLGTDTETRHLAAGEDEVIAECEASLERLGIDAIDCYQLHWPAPEAIETTARTVEALYQAGKIRSIGVCNYSVEQLETWVQTGVPLHCVQIPYSLFRRAVREDVLPWCEAQGCAAIAYSPLFRGMLFGSWDRKKTFPEGDARREHPAYHGAGLERHLAVVDRLRDIAEEHDMDCAQLAIGMLTVTPGLTGCIVGARNAAQGRYLGELGMPLKRSVIDAVEAVLAEMPLA